MVELLGGAELPVQAGLGLESTIGGGAVPWELTEAYAVEQEIEDRRRKEAAIQAEWEASQRERLAIMEAEAAAAQEAYYEVGGTGYGTEPGGPDVVYYGDTVLYETEPGSLVPLGLDWPSLPDIPDKYLLAGALVLGALFLK